MVETRDDGRATLRFEIRRTVRFARDGAGWRAAVTFEPVTTPGTTPAQANFARIMAAFAGQTIAYRLDSAGGIIAIDDEAAWWQRFTKAVAGAAPGDPAATRRAASIAATLAALPEAQRRAVLTEPLDPLLAADEATRTRAGERAITLPAQPILGSGATVPARETTTIAPGLVRIVIEADGALPGDAGAGSFHLVRTREIDAATGLARDTRDETVTDLPGPPAARLTIVRTITLNDKVS